MSRPRLLLLGPPRLVLPSGASPVFPERGFALACILLLDFGGEGPRAALASRLWETADDKRAHGHLRQLIWRIRRIEADHGVKILTDSKDSVGLSDTLSSDLSDLLACPSLFWSAPDLSFNPAHLLLALKAEGELSAWIEATRDKLVNLVVNAGLAAHPNGPAEADLARLERLASLAPFSEGVLIAQLQALFARAQIPKAVGLYAEFARRMRAELGAEPAEQTRLLFEEGLKGSHRITQDTVLADQDGELPPRLILLPPTLGHSTPDPASLRLAETLIADVTVALSRLRSLAVVAAETGRLLARPRLKPNLRVDVDFVLRTRLADPFIRGLPHMGFYLELFRARDDRLVWAERLSFSPDLTAERYEDMIGLVVQRIAGKAERHRSIGANPRAYPAAYLTYLEGQQHLQSLHLPLVRRARQLFRAAQDVAPQHAEAASALARTFIVEWVLRNGNDDELLERAEKAAQRALSLDPESALGERELGLAALYRRQYDESLRHFEAAEAGSPHHADMIADHADALVHCSMLDEAAERIKRALDLNPAAPDSYLWTAGGASFLLGKFDAALTYISRMQNIEPALKLYAASAAMAGQLTLAHQLRDRELEIRPDFCVEDWMTTMPMRNPQHVKQYAEGLRAAGFQ